MPSRAGSPNKNKQALIALLQAKYPGYHPVMELAAIANDDVKCKPCEGKEGNNECEKCSGTGMESISMDMKFNANKEVANYITPKLKAVEHTGSIDSVVYKPNIKRFDGSLDEGIDE